MTATTVSGNATPTTTQGADAATTETASSLAALMGFGELAKDSTSTASAEADTEQNSQPEAGQVAVLSQLETASDGATSDSPATEETETEASAEETAAEPPKAEAQAEPDSEDALEEWLATLPKGAARKLRAQHRQIAELKRELADTKAKQPEVTAQTNASAPVVIDNRLEQITDLRELDSVEAKSRDTVRSAERALDTVDDLRDAVDVDMDQVVQQLKAAKYDPPDDREGLVKFLGEIKRGIRAERAKAAENLDAIPRRRSHLERETQAYEAAAADYPWLKSRQGDDWKLFEHVVKNRPEVKLLGPDWPAIVAVQIEGHKSLIARRAAKAKAAPVAAKAAAEPPKQPSRSATPRPAANSAARSRFEQSASEQDLAALMPG